ncbi:DUF5813 family protein [Halobiforma nitratireducens]|uniref:YbjN domain-containing protein n=1 Tax=Halobiforma nitratireducens JCM 10879 TaxID=1227454 RepID=M0L9R7_9EURY|nr:DUF5813 family protein [Halobiforma nitratireducens]EMA29214.1 hypothetical protein C446_17474 [Halobiforma nitratireducens JCM 10879]
MTAIPDAAADALDAHDAFEPIGDEPDDGRYRLETTVFDTVVTATPAEGERDAEFSLTVTLPTLDEAVDGETVAPVVEDGWFETLERRLEDVFTVAHTSTHDDPALERGPRDVTVDLEYLAWDAMTGVEDAKSLIEYVEGTFAQGIVPGYDYRGPAATLLESAQQNAQNATEEGGGMPM